MGIPVLPMELWARIASFVEFEDLFATFWALRSVGLLPDPCTTPSNALLQFCSEATATDEEDPSIATIRRTFVEMGFSTEEIDDALGTYPENVDACLDVLIVGCMREVEAG